MRRRDKENIKIQGPIAATLLDRAIFLTTEKRSLRNAAKGRHTPTHDDLANVRAIDAEKRITRGLHRLVLVHFDASARQAGVIVNCRTSRRFSRVPVALSPPR